MQRHCRLMPFPAPCPACFTAITAVRLVNGPNANAGQVEVQIGGYWGNVKPIGDQEDEAKVGKGLPAGTSSPACHMHLPAGSVPFLAMAACWAGSSAGCVGGVRRRVL